MKNKEIKFLGRTFLYVDGTILESVEFSQSIGWFECFEEDFEPEVYEALIKEINK